MKRFTISPKVIIKYVILLLFSALFLLLFSLWTSPFYRNWYGCDASFFTMSGRGILHGWVPYRDFFDLKGPCFFFIEALGQFLCKGRTGAFLLQVIALFFSYVLIIRICRLFISRAKTIFVLGVFSFFNIATLWGGNTLEEYMLPLSLLVLYLVLRDFYRDATQSIKASTALITGLCFGILLFSKITVGAPVAGIVFAICIFFIKNRRMKELLEFLLFSFLGVLIVTTIIFIYFSYYGMLREMLYSVFVFAFKRSMDFGETYNLRWELKISPCYFALAFVLFQVIRSKEKEMVKKNSFILTVTASTALITAVCLHLGTPFIYYFTTVYPVLVPALIAMFVLYEPFTLFKTLRLDLPLLLFLIPLCYYASHSASTLNTVIYGRNNGYYQSYYEKAKEMASLIPDCDKDSVYSFNMDMQWFEIMDVLPCYPYTINLQFFVSLDKSIQNNIINRLNDSPPKWVVVGGDLYSYLPDIAEQFFPKYTLIYESDYGSLYLYNQQ